MPDNVINALNKIVDVAEQINTINKRLITLMIVIIVSSSCTLIAISYFYFCSDNYYPQINQTQSDNIGSNANIKIGGNK